MAFDMEIDKKGNLVFLRTPNIKSSKSKKKFKRKIKMKKISRRINRSK